MRDVPTCEECDVYDHNPPDHAEKFCQRCLRYVDNENPLLDKLLRVMALIDCEAPIGRYELSEEEWLLMGKIRAERSKLMELERKENGPT